VMFGHEQMQVAIDAIVDLAKEAGKPPIEWTPPPSDEELVAEVERVAGADLTAAYAIAQKQERHTAIAEARQRCVAALAPDESAKWTPAQVEAAFQKLERKIVRGRILAGQPRIDGRDTRTVRPIEVQV